MLCITDRSVYCLGWCLINAYTYFFVLLSYYFRNKDNENKGICSKVQCKNQAVFIFVNVDSILLRNSNMRPSCFFNFDKAALLFQEGI